MDRLYRASWPPAVVQAAFCHCGGHLKSEETEQNSQQREEVGLEDGWSSPPQRGEGCVSQRAASSLNRDTKDEQTRLNRASKGLVVQRSSAHTFTQYPGEKGSA
ncbi:unnamed protein product [Boreogadus saida]